MLVLKSLVIGVISILICSCDDRYQPIDHLESYHEALSRSKLIRFESLGSDEKLKLKKYPEIRYRELALSKFDIGLLDFLSLQRCDVGIVAGERNSILGRVMAFSQRFLYELRIIKAIESCDIENDELRNELINVAEVKKDELPKAFANAIWAGKESEAFFSLSNGLVPMSPDQSGYQSLIASLSDLTRIKSNLEDLPELSSQDFEQHMKVLLESEYGGKLLVTLNELSYSLEQIATVIEKVEVNSESCGAPIAYLKELFTQHYIVVIQPYMARINRVAYQVLPSLERLTDVATPELTLFMKQFDEDSSSVWGRYKKASIRHARAWSHLFQQCGVQLG